LILFKKGVYYKPDKLAYSILLFRGVIHITQSSFKM
jgi:hypothetical protein